MSVVMYLLTHTYIVYSTPKSSFSSTEECLITTDYGFSVVLVYEGSVSLGELNKQCH